MIASSLIYSLWRWTFFLNKFYLITLRKYFLKKHAKFVSEFYREFLSEEAECALVTGHPVQSQMYYIFCQRLRKTFSFNHPHEKNKKNKTKKTKQNETNTVFQINVSVCV